MSERGTCRVVHGEIGDGQIGGRVDAHELNRRVLEVKAGDRRTLQAVGIEEFGLGLATCTQDLHVRIFIVRILGHRIRE